MREIDVLYTNVEVIIDKLNSFIIQDLRKLCEPERDSLTAAYDLLVHALSCINDASFYRKHEEDEEEEVRVCVSEKPDPFWNRDDIDFSKVHATYTGEQKGEKVPEEVPYDNFNHTYYLGDEKKFMDKFLIAARNKLWNTYELNYDCLSIDYFSDKEIVIKKEYRE